MRCRQRRSTPCLASDVHCPYMDVQNLICNNRVDSFDYPMPKPLVSWIIIVSLMPCQVMLMRLKFKSFMAVLIFGISSSLVCAEDAEWVVLKDTEKLQKFMEGLIIERPLIRGKVSKAEFFSDGTSLLHSWGGTFFRTWEVDEDAQV